MGWNNKKSHPNSLTERQHAEFNCLVGIHKHDVTGSSMYVARLNGNISKPCKDCQLTLMAAGVKRVFYIDREGQIECLKM